MIIQVRGTSGSGKSTVMRMIMDHCSRWKPIHVEGRKQPLYYKGIPAAWSRTVVLGHYETACGGCDTIGSAAKVFEWIDTLKNLGNILCEGLLLSEDSKWSSQLEDLRVLYLMTPLDECLTNISKRRKEAGNEKELNPTNTTNRVKAIETSRIKLTEAGVMCRRVSCDQAVKLAIQWLEVSNG